MDLLKETRIAAISSMENYMLEIIDSIESEYGELTIDEQQQVGNSMSEFMNLNLPKLKLIGA